MVSAALKGRYGDVRKFLDSGVPVDSIGNGARGYTPLHMAAVKGHYDICKLLIDRGATVDKANCNGFTALHMAGNYGHHDICQLLIDRGATVDRADSDGSTALHIAAEFGHSDIVTLLLEHGASPTNKEKHGYTPLDLARTKGNYDCTKKIKAKMCWNCHAKESDGVILLKCGGCKKARYCDQVCQTMDWGDRHLEQCQQIQERKRNKMSKSKT